MRTGPSSLPPCYRGGMLLLLGMLCAAHGVDAGSPDAGSTPVVITDAKELGSHLGQTVTLRGIQARTKQPTVLGVDVDGEYALSDVEVEVTGVLKRYEI